MLKNPFLKAYLLRQKQELINTIDQILVNSSEDLIFFQVCQLLFKDNSLIEIIVFESNLRLWLSMPIF
jgi:hypothetical protein